MVKHLLDRRGVVQPKRFRAVLAAKSRDYSIQGSHDSVDLMSYHLPVEKPEANPVLGCFEGS